MPGALHAAFVRSPHAHALIRSIDARAARAMSGVHAVLTLDDLAPALAKRRMVRQPRNSGSNRSTNAGRSCSPTAKSSYVGEPVAIVVADSRYIAEDAAALVEVDYEVLPAVDRSAASAARRARAGAARARLQQSSHL